MPASSGPPVISILATWNSPLNPPLYHFWVIPEQIEFDFSHLQLKKPHFPERPNRIYFIDLVETESQLLGIILR
jgi:hypothetical protein